MPFIDQIIDFINIELAKGSLNKEKLQPAKFHRLATITPRLKPGARNKKELELLPAIVLPGGQIEFVTAESNFALQCYHRLLSKQYSFVSKSYGNGHDIQMVAELMLVFITNSAITGRSKEALEPAVLFGMPQHLSPAALSELGIGKCLIRPVSSNLDQVAVFRQEYPQSTYFLNAQVGMFSIKYKFDLTFSQACVDACLCEK